MIKMATDVRGRLVSTPRFHWMLSRGIRFPGPRDLPSAGYASFRRCFADWGPDDSWWIMPVRLVYLDCASTRFLQVSSIQTLEPSTTVKVHSHMNASRSHTPH